LKAPGQADRNDSFRGVPGSQPSSAPSHHADQCGIAGGQSNPLAALYHPRPLVDTPSSRASRRGAPRMHTSISALDIYPNVRTLLGMIVGLALAHMLTQFARIIEFNRWRKLYWPHMVWAAFMLVYIIHFWWWQVRLSMLPTWTFGAFAFIVFYALLVFLACTVVLPASLSDGRIEDDQ